jgi:hypothetical protein
VNGQTFGILGFRYGEGNKAADFNANASIFTEASVETAMESIFQAINALKIGAASRQLE